MAKLMRRALDRLVEQSFRDFEVILVDDGSKDGSSDICEEYSRKYPYFKTIHKLNGGLSSARNAGISVAHGEWITFCDPDDLPYTNWLENFDPYKLSAYDLICQGFKTDNKCLGINRNQDSLKFSFDGSSIDLVKIFFANNAIGYTWCKLYKRSIIQNNNISFDEKVKLKEDELFLLQYLKYCRKVIAVDKIGYFYFMPDWKNKYIIPVEVQLYFHRKSIEYSTNLCYGNDNTILYHYLDSMNDQLMLAFNKSPKRSYLMDIREINKNYPLATRMRPYLKRIILADPSMTFSWLTLNLHMKLKSLWLD